MLSLHAPKFAIVDVDAGIPLTERQKVAAALQRQVREDWAPLWGTGEACEIRAATPDAPALPGEMEIRLQNTPTQAGALALHDRKPDGSPIAYVFVALCKQYGDEWSAAASHEILELLGDPYLHLCVELDNGEIWDRESCDRVQDASFGYAIDGVAVSDFNLPACFEPPADLLNARFDFQNHSTKPNQTLQGGYSQKFDPSKGWTMVGELSEYRKYVHSMGISRAAKRQARNPQPNFLVRLWRRLFG